MPFNVAWSEGQLEKKFHGLNYFITEIRLSTNDLEDAIVSSVDIFWYVHGIGMFIAWNFFVLIGYIAARFLKHYPWWIFLHILGGTIPAFFSVGIIIAAIIKSNHYLLFLNLYQKRIILILP
jgi:hypothetical protein